MADDILKKSQASAPAPSTANNDDDDLNLDNLYDLSGVSGSAGGTSTPPTNVAGLTANLPVTNEQLQGFRSQSSGLGEAAQADAQVLADLSAKAVASPSVIQSSSDVAPTMENKMAPTMPKLNDTAEADVNLDLDKDLAGEGDWLVKLSDALQEDKAVTAAVAPVVAEIKTDEVVAPKMEVLSSTEGTKEPLAEIVDLDLDDQAVATSLPEIKTVSLKKVDSEAAKIEADLEANTIDLDEEEAANKPADDLFAPSGPVPTLSKVSVAKSVPVEEEKRVAPVQKLMKTDTIFNKGDKINQLNLNVSPEGKKLKSPVEELAEMTLEDWSRKGDIAAERAAKVKEQILALGAKSIVNEIEGLNAWRRSAVSQKYLDLGIAAYLSEKSLEEIISEQKELSVEEWFTINQLNRELMI